MAGVLHWLTVRFEDPAASLSQDEGPALHRAHARAEPAAAFHAVWVASGESH